MSEGPSQRRRAGLVAAIVVVLIVASLLIAGVFEVPDGEVVAVRRGGSTSVYEPGRHWRLPLGGDTLRLPRSPVAAALDVSATSREGAEIVVRLDGGFAIAAGSELGWLEANGWVPFLDGVRAAARGILDRHLAAVPATELLGDEALPRLTKLLLDGLEARGVVTSDVTVSLPAAANPALGALARHRAEQLVTKEHAARRKVLLLGWDAADWLILRPLIAAGRMPNLARLVESGASGDLRSVRPLLSPIVWTTIATGKPMMEHGIVDFVEIDPATGGRLPVMSTSRKVQSLWTIATAMGLKSDVVGYWATWPAEKILGRMVSERVAYQLFSFAKQDDPEGKVYPPELWPTVADLVVTADKIPYPQVHRFLKVSKEEFQQAWDSLPEARRTENKINHFRKILAATETYQRIALKLLEDQADLSIFYFEGTDTVCHLFANEMPPPLAGISAEEIRKYGGAVQEFYAWADELLGQLLDRIADDTVVVLVSDHGFYTGELRPDSDPADFASGAAQWHRPTGMIVAGGAGVPKATVEGATVFDVAPTVLGLLGLPVPGDMEGRVLTQVLPRGVSPRLGQLASYESMPRPDTVTAEGSRSADRERLQELVALGYISPGSDTQAGGERPRQAESTQGRAREAAPAVPPQDGTPAEPAMSPQELAERGRYTELYNVASALAADGDLKAAREKYLEVIQLAPGYGPGYEALAKVARDLDGRCAELDVLVQGVVRSQTEELSMLPSMVDAARACGRLETAAATLERVSSRYADKPEYQVAVGMVAEGEGDPEAALASYRAALERKPTQEVGLDRAIALLRATGRADEARHLFRRALQASSNSIEALDSLVAIALANEWGADAEAICLRILNSDPGNVGVQRNLGIARLKQNKLQAARADLERVVASDPDDPMAQYYLGFLDALEGKFDAALAKFARAEGLGLETADLYVARARALFFKQDRAGAEKALRRALEVDPSDAEAQKLLALLDRAGAGRR